MPNHAPRLPAQALPFEDGPKLVAAHFGSPQQHPLKFKYLHDWKLVKRARFNAAKRLERKQSAGMVTLAIVALYGGLISVFNLMFKHRVGGDTREVLEYVAVVSSWLTLIVGLTEQQKGHGGNARELHDCAREVNDLRRLLAATPIYDEAQLVPFMQRYHQSIHACRPNHDEVDYALAEAAGDADQKRRLMQAGKWNERAHRAQLRAARLVYHLNTYWFYVIVWFAPALVGVALWMIVPGAANPQ